MDRDIIPLERSTASYGSSLGQSLVVSTLLHALPLGGILLWQGGVDAKVGGGHQYPMRIEMVYIDPETSQNDFTSKETPPTEEASVESNSKEETVCVKSKIAKSSVRRAQEEEMQGISLGTEDTIIVTPCSGNPEPPYPLRAREENIQGTVHLRLTINELGHVIKATPIAPLAHPLLEKAALETARQWRYDISGPARTIIRPIPIVFKLD